MSYHCSLSSIQSVGSPSHKFFLPPEYQTTTGYTNLNQLWTAIGGKPPGEWRLAAKFFIGQLRGLDRSFGTLAALDKTKCLIVLTDGRSFFIGHKDNFEKIEVPREKPVMKPSPKVEQRKKDVEFFC
jgi:hypothetical protein